MLWAKRIVLVAIGIVVLSVCAQIKVPVWPSPVAISLGTFAVLTIGAAYGPRLGLATMLGWLFLGAVGFNVFQNTSVGRDRPRLHDGRDRRLSRRLPARDRLPRLGRPPRLGPQRPGHGRRAPRRQRPHLRARASSGSAT